MPNALSDRLDLDNYVRDMEATLAWSWFKGEIDRLKDGAVEAVVAGLDPVKYREKIGFIAALTAVLELPGELHDDATELRNELAD